MAASCSRRSFLVRGAVGGLGVAFPFATRFGLASEAEESAGKSLVAVAERPAEAREGVDPDEGAPALVEAVIEACGGISKFVAPGDVVWVKPNIAWDRKTEQAADSNPQVVATLIRLCLDAGAKKVQVTDRSCNEPRRTFASSGIQEAAEAAGAEVFIMDPNRFKDLDLGGETIQTWPVYGEALEVDKIINVAIAKHHNLTQLTLSMKNLMGLVGGNRNRMHQEIGTVLADLTQYFKPTLSVVDAVRILVRNGPVGGNLEDVERRDTVIASTDLVALDAYAATLFGLTGEDVAGVKEASARGLGEMDLTKVEMVRKEIA
jgi:uncharacterized protein (DUF362 family)